MNTKNALQTPKEPAPIMALGTKSASKKKPSKKRTTKVSKAASKKTSKKAAVRAKPAQKKKSSVKKNTTKKTVAKKVTKPTSTANANTTSTSSVTRALNTARTAKTTVGKKPAIEVYKLAESAPNQRYFVLANGKPVQHVAELAEVLEDLEDHVFDHHVNPERNDFHNWVKDVFQDIELAKKMLGVTDKKHLQLVIYKHAANKAFNR